ncbi:MAG: DUF2846 domain-containing protein [Rhizobiaceae bacterium]|nr:DUF2846 domain-containing protein [Rhizobiaceae bacterium]
MKSPLSLGSHLAWVVLGLLVLQSCARGPYTAQSTHESKLLKQGLGRIAVYRTDRFTLALPPNVRVNGVEAGRCRTNGIFFIDVLPGKHKVGVTTQFTEELDIAVRENETTYIECSMRPDFPFGTPHFEEVEPDVAAAVIAELALIDQR